MRRMVEPQGGDGVDTNNGLLYDQGYVVDHIEKLDVAKNSDLRAFLERNSTFLTTPWPFELKFWTKKLKNYALKKHYPKVLDLLKQELWFHEDL